MSAPGKLVLGCQIERDLLSGQIHYDGDGTGKNPYRNTVDIKDMYNTRDYVKSSANPYSPGWSGVGSFFLPGLGQMICGETGRGLAILGGDLAFDIWNICDAVRIAKVKNMYFQDLQGRRTMEFNMYPSVNLSMTSDGARPVAGMGVSVRF